MKLIFFLAYNKPSTLFRPGFLCLPAIGKGHFKTAHPTTTKIAHSNVLALPTSGHKLIDTMT